MARLVITSTSSHLFAYRSNIGKLKHGIIKHINGGYTAKNIEVEQVNV